MKENKTRTSDLRLQPSFQPSSIIHQTSSLLYTSSIPLHLQSVAALCNQLLSDESLTILGKKINTMNNPTNADSLARPLEEAGYDLKPNDKDALKMRNTFLHGGLVKGSVEKQANEIFYLSLMLHKLACIIILKRAGFSGYILNNLCCSIARRQ